MENILLGKLKELMYNEGINLKEFLERTNISNTVYYSIKDGSKKSLSPLHIRAITNAFPTYTYDYFFGTNKSLESNEKKEWPIQVNFCMFHS